MWFIPVPVPVPVPVPMRILDEGYFCFRFFCDWSPLSPCRVPDRLVACFKLGSRLDLGFSFGLSFGSSGSRYDKFCL